MASLTCFNRRFTPNWQMTLLTVLISVLFIYLGMWQLQRAQEKKGMLAAADHLTKQPPVAWQPGIKPKQYQPIVIQGRYLPQVFLLDNQHYQHQFGYHVLTPLALENGEIVLVDQGWIAGHLNRHTFPKINLPVTCLQLTGQVYYPSAKTWVLGPIIEKKSNNIVILEAVDIRQVSQFLHKSVYPFIIRLNKTEKDGYIREWPIVSMPPARHQAYAVQWFAMAFIIWLIFIGLNLKKIDE